MYLCGLLRIYRKNQNRMSEFKLLLIYMIFVNVVTFLVYGVDKLKAKQSRWRISENALIALALIGGSIGALLGMYLWRHKTQHKKFKYGVPVILVLQIVLIVVLMCQ